MSEAPPTDDAVADDVERTTYVDAATRVSRPSAFDNWYYGIEDRLGQGTVGMGVCFVVFLLVLVFAVLCSPI